MEHLGFPLSSHRQEKETKENVKEKRERHVTRAQKDAESSLSYKTQAAQIHVARDGCNVIYITYVTRAGVAIQATVENIRDFLLLLSWKE